MTSLVRIGLKAALTVAVCIGLAACSTARIDDEVVVGAVQTPGSDDVLIASKHFSSGSYGNASKHFKLAVEKEPKNPDAWLGLAASYDRLRRFDLADRAYKNVRKLKGDTPEILNNIGYSYFLRGNLPRAREFMSAAYAGNAGDPRILSNIETLNEMLSKRGHSPIPI